MRRGRGAVCVPSSLTRWQSGWITATVKVFSKLKFWKGCSVVKTRQYFICTCNTIRTCTCTLGSNFMYYDLIYKIMIFLNPLDWIYKGFFYLISLFTQSNFCNVRGICPLMTIFSYNSNLENCPNLSNKCIYISMACSYSVNGIIGLQHEVTVFTGSCSLIVHLNKYLSAVPFGCQTKLATLF